MAQKFGMVVVRYRLEVSEPFIAEERFRHLFGKVTVTRGNYEVTVPQKRTSLAREIEEAARIHKFVARIVKTEIDETFEH